MSYRMTLTSIRIVVLALLWIMALPAAASAAPSAELVQVAPQAFESKQPLLGYLTRPSSKGPFPAVVILHGCAGFGPRETHWADLVRSWGYVALAIDSFTPRNLTSCAGPTSGDAVDAFAALQYLTTQPFAMPDRVVVLGFSLGRIAAIGDVESNLWEQIYHARFRGAVAFYPSWHWRQWWRRRAHADPDRREGRLGMGAGMQRHGCRCFRERCSDQARRVSRCHPRL